MTFFYYQLSRKKRKMLQWTMLKRLRNVWRVRHQSSNENYFLDGFAFTELPWQSIVERLSSSTCWYGITKITLRQKQIIFWGSYWNRQKAEPVSYHLRPKRVEVTQTITELSTFAIIAVTIYLLHRVFTPTVRRHQKTRVPIPKDFQNKLLMKCVNRYRTAFWLF